MIAPGKKLPASFSGKGPSAKAYLALITVCFFWGTTWIASKIGVRYMPALQLAGMRQLLGGLFYIVYFLGKGRILPKGKEWKPILILSVLNFIFSNAFSTWAVKYIPAGLASIIGATFPLWIVVAGLTTAKRRLPFKALLGFALGFAGICVIFIEHLGHFVEAGFMFGIVLSLVSTWTWAAGMLYTKKQVATFNPYFSLGWQMIISGLTLLAFSKGSGIWIPIEDIPVESWASIWYLVIFSSILTFLAFIYALQHLSAEQVSVYAYVNPIVAVLLGSLIFDEKLTIYIAIGGVIILYGIYLINSALRKQL